MSKDFKPNALKKLWLKLTDATEHNKYKQQRSHHKITSKLYRFIDAGMDTTPDELLNNAGAEINVLHDGNAGDIMYALPLIKKLHQIASRPVNLILKVNEPMKIGSGYDHPLGNVMLNEKMIAGLTPLLATQPYINKVETLAGQQIDLDLTLFRKAGFATDKGDIARWVYFTAGINANLSQAWLSVTPDKAFADKIVLARSSRYNNPLIDHSFLSQYPDLVFVGVKSEYDEMRKSIPGLKWHSVNNFLELAEVIAGCKLFIGNQSFPYAIAEGLKVPRLLEVFYQIPNVMPEGGNGYDLCFQKHFEWLVANYNKLA